MSDGTKIEWTDATANVVNGCTVTSPGCTNCYAMRLAGTRMKNHPTREGLTINTKAGPVWNGEIFFNEKALKQVLSWSRPRKIFWNAHGDLFHENVPDEYIDRCFAVMAMTSQHQHQVLTKRSARMREYMATLVTMDPDARLARFDQIAVDITNSPCAIGPFEDIEEREGWPLPNVWLGVSVEDQTRADERVPDLLATPAAVRWISAEPLLGPVDLTEVCDGATSLDPECWGDCNCDGPYGYDAGCRRNGGDGTLTRKIDWVVAGGESGPNARPMHPDWARSLRDQCQKAGVSFLFKQWGEHLPVFDRDIEDPDWRRCHVWQHSHPKGQWLNLAGGTGFHGERVVYMDRPGKGMAGRLLDGEQYDGYPS